MDHAAALRPLPPERLRCLTARSNRAGLSHLAGHLGAILATGLWIGAKMPLWPLALPLHGILIVFLFTLQHEATHQTPFAARWLNEAAGHMAGLLLMLPFLWFRYFHLAHHRFTNDPQRDPELLAGGHPQTRRAYLWHVSGLPYWAAMARTLVANATGRAGESFIPPKAKGKITREARLYLLTYALAVAAMIAAPWLIWLWLVPVLIGQPFLRLYLLAEHARCPQVANMLENSRTTFTNRAMRALAWNMPYHAEHHSHPNVPFHHLPKLHQDLAPHLQSTAPGYRAFTRRFRDGLR